MAIPFHYFKQFKFFMIELSEFIYYHAIDRGTILDFYLIRLFLFGERSYGEPWDNHAVVLEGPVGHGLTYAVGHTEPSP